MVEPEIDTSLADLATELEATAALPVDREASRWLGEAQAVAADLTRGEPDAETIRRRVGHVVDLLDNVEDTGHPDAEDHVARAKTLASDVLDRLE